MNELNQAILRLMLLEGSDYTDILNNIHNSEDRSKLLLFLKSKITKFSKGLKDDQELERFINSIRG